MTKVSFFLMAYPESADEILLDIPEGATLKEVAEMCAAAEDVTAPVSAILESDCSVNGLYVASDYRFTGKEPRIDFVNSIGDG